MYKPNKKSVRQVLIDSDCIEKFETSAYHPFSYYSLGGSDPSGDHLNDTAEVSYDSPDAVNSADSSPNVFNEPRANALDVAEALGTMDVEDIREKDPKEDDEKK